MCADVERMEKIEQESITCQAVGSIGICPQFWAKNAPASSIGRHRLEIG